MHTTNTINYKKISHYGPGGRLCNCCGPSPKNRKKHDRMVKHREKFLSMKAIRSEILESCTP